MSDTQATSSSAEPSTPSVFDEPYTPGFVKAREDASDTPPKGKSSAFDVRSKPEPEADEGEDVEAEEPDQDGEGVADAAGDEAPEGGDAEEQEEPKAPSKGTRDKPFALNDIADQYVKVKVDGKEQVISLKQAAENGMMRATFNNRLREVADTMREMKQAHDATVEEREKLRGAVTKVFSDSRELFDLLSDRHPKTLEEIARGWYHQQKRLREMSPEEKTEYLIGLERRKFEKEAKTREERLARERAELEESRTAAEVEKKRVEMAPWHEEAMRKAGFPTIDANFSTLAKNLMRERAAATQQGEITREIYVQSFIDTAKVYGAKAPAKPKLAPRQETSAPQRTARTQKQYPAGPEGFFARKLDALKGR